MNKISVEVLGLFQHRSTTVCNCRSIIHGDAFYHFATVHFPRLFSVCAPSHTVPYTRIINISVNFHTTICELILASAIALAISEHAFKAMAIVIIVPAKSLDGVILPVTRIQILKQKIMFDTCKVSNVKKMI